MEILQLTTDDQQFAIGLGTSVAKGALKLWFEDDPIAEGAATGLLDVFKRKTGDLRAQRAGSRQFEQIAERFAESLQEVIEAVSTKPITWVAPRACAGAHFSGWSAACCSLPHDNAAQAAGQRADGNRMCRPAALTVGYAERTFQRTSPPSIRRAGDHI